MQSPMTTAAPPIMTAQNEQLDLFPATPRLRAWVRQMTEGDIPGVVALQKRAFPKMPPWTPAELRGHMQTFPAGQLVAVDRDGRVLGSASSLIVGADTYAAHASWEAITGKGSFATHDPAGDTLYGADVGVDPDARGMGVGSALYEARREICRRFCLARIAAGGRIPGYGECAETHTPHAYVALVVAGDRHDATLSFQLDNGFKVAGLIRGYLPSDEASRGWATSLVWDNPNYLEVATAA